MVKANKGSVLVFVLIFIAFAASTILLVHEKSINSMEEASEDFYENQAHIYAMTALTAVQETLRDDTNTYDSKRDEWTLIPVLEIPYGYISVDIQPVNAKISLNNMVSQTQKTSERYLEACRNIAAAQEADSLICEEVKDYLDPDDETTPGGGENILYERYGTSFRTKNSPLSSLYELRLLMNNNEQFAKVKDYLTVYTPENAININFASAETIKAFLPEIADFAEDIVNYTRTSVYKDSSNIKNAADIDPDVYQEILPYITVKSSLFYVKTEVTLNDKPRYYHALIHKQGSIVEIVNFLAGLNGQYY